MKNGAYLIGFVLLVSGCLCCGGTDLSGLGGKIKGDAGAETCEAPYIRVGDSCCLDDNGNGVCDDEEASDVTQSGDDTPVNDDQSTETTETTVTTIPEDDVTETTVSTNAPTTTVAQGSYASTYECVRNAGYDPNKVIYAYSLHCGNGFTATASTVSMRVGVDILPVNIGGLLEDKKVKMLECFYGAGSPEMSACPRLLCPKTGRYETLTGMASASVNSQMTGFANKCK